MAMKREYPTKTGLHLEIQQLNKLLELRKKRFEQKLARMLEEGRRQSATVARGEIANCLEGGEWLADRVENKILTYVDERGKND